MNAAVRRVLPISRRIHPGRRRDRVGGAEGTCSMVRTRGSMDRGYPVRSPRGIEGRGNRWYRRWMEIEIGIGKTARRGYGFDDVAIVPSRRTRDPADVEVSWELDAWRFELPLMASAMDAVVSPATAIEIGRLGGLAVLNLEGLQTRYEDPEPVFDEIAGLSEEKATRRMQELYREPIKEELVVRRVREIREGGVTAAASLTPQRVREYAPLVLEAELDLLVIQGTVVSAEHVSTRSEPLNLKEFIARFEIPVVVGGCASYQTALHLMRTGADIAKAIACGADAVMIGSPLSKAYESPGRGFHWGMATFHPDLPRGTRVRTRQIGSLQEILVGPAHENDGTLNLFGALRTSMATCGYGSIKEFQKAEVMVAPAIRTEGKALQQQQGVGMG